MKVLILAPQPFFEVRGTPLAVLALVRALTRLGHRVDLLTFRQGDDVTMPGLRHLRSLPLPVGHVKAGPSMANLLLDLPFMAEAAWRMATGRYDVVHAVEEAAHLAAPLARLLGLPYVMDVDSSIPDQLRYSGFATGGPLLWLAERLDRHGLRHASAVVTVCTSLTEGVRRSAASGYRERVDASGSDELSELAAAFNTAGAEVQSQLERLEGRVPWYALVGFRKRVCSAVHCLIPRTSIP